MSIKEKIAELKRTIPADVTMVAVSKQQSHDSISEAYDAGQRIFAENRPQELRHKHSHLPEDIEWHYIGALQTNKVKYIAPFVSLIHSVDSDKLLNFIDKEAAKVNRTIDVLMEIHIAQEESKQGWSINELEEYLDSGNHLTLNNIRIRGVMGMATFCDDKLQIKKEFTTLRYCFDSMKERYFADKPWFDTISMGMTGDYLIAIEAGSNMVRIGSYIFAEH